MLEIREIKKEDISSIALIRVEDWGTYEYWIMRISGYLNLELNAQQSLKPRKIFVAQMNNKIVGFIAGHLSKRFECHGELQWINVTSKFQNKNIASELLIKLAIWFVEQNAKLVCINVDADNKKGVSFYKKHKAEQLNKHWMIWKDISVTI